MHVRHTISEVCCEKDSSSEYTAMCLTFLYVLHLLSNPAGLFHMYRKPVKIHIVGGLH